MLDKTHAADAQSWVEAANLADADFPIQNLPYCAFTAAENSQRLGVGIGDQILDLNACAKAGLLSDLSEDVVQALQASVLNDFMALGRDKWRQVRQHFFTLLLSDGDLAEKAKALSSDILVAQSDATLALAINIGDFTDYECSHHHAKRMRKLMSGATKPLPNGYWLPRAYHGRSSSVVVSGSPIYLPIGQIEGENETPVVKPCVNFDYELELGIIVGTGNERGHPISITEAEDHIFGFCIVNDWSARDIQKWERLPLGPFLGKNHATSVSPWVVTMEAMAPFRAPQQAVPEEGWPALLPYLDSKQNRAAGAIDVKFDVLITTEKMREECMDPVVNSRNKTLDASWTIAQIITQHTSNGCNLRSGDLIGSGTVSGEAPSASACLMELSEAGSIEREMPTGEKRSFLAIGDEVVFKGCSQKEGYPRIGFGEVRGLVLPPAVDYS
jgi:fumarylacetoacetase